MSIYSTFTRGGAARLARLAHLNGLCWDSRGSVSATVGYASMAIRTADIALHNLMLNRLNRITSLNRSSDIKTFFLVWSMVKFQNDRVWFSAVDTGIDAQIVSDELPNLRDCVLCLDLRTADVIGFVLFIVPTGVSFFANWVISRTPGAAGKITDTHFVFLNRNSRQVKVESSNLSPATNFNPNRSIPAFRSDVESARSARPRLAPMPAPIIPSRQPMQEGVM